MISLLLLLKNSTAIGVDISNLALEVAAENALKNQENSGALRIELINSKGEKERYNFK